MTRSSPFFALPIALVLVCLGAIVPSTSSADQGVARLCRDVQARQAKANCRLVAGFYEAFFNRRQFEVAEKVVAESYIQHNPDTPNGRKALVGYFTSFMQEHPKAHSKIVRVSASGDLVWLHVHDVSSPEDRGSAVLDIFRVHRGQIVEHWDVIQPVPEKQAHGNTMF